MNEGKRFETDFRDSLDNHVLLYRLPDAAQSFEKSSNLRFSRKNPFDYILWDSEKRVLYALELKTVGDKSISFERTKNDKGKIHYHQIEGLKHWNIYNGTRCGFIIEFRRFQKTIFIDIDDFNSLILKTQKNSFSLDDLDKYEIKYVDIPCHLKRTRYKYDITCLLSSE